MKKYLLGFALLTSLHGWSQSNHLSEQTYAEIEQKVIDWRRHFHQNPELSNRGRHRGNHNSLMSRPGWRPTKVRIR